MIGRLCFLDRKDLDNQTTSEFTKFASEFNTGISSGDGKANSLIVGTGSAKELSKTLLADANSNVVIVTTRQKAGCRFEICTKNKKSRRAQIVFKKINGATYCFFIVDECHRAVSAENMMDVKKYFLDPLGLAFTGTPIFEENKKSKRKDN